MLQHKNVEFQTANRVVILGGSGFVGQALKNKLEDSQVEVLALSSDDLNLDSDNTVDSLTNIIRVSDTLVILSALTPDKGKGIDTLMKNLRMIENVCAVMQQCMPQHVVYFSSDAVYPLSYPVVNEQTPSDAPDLYGIMHRTREIMLQTCCEHLCVLRPTLIYGSGDTHNSYGPNRFRRLALGESNITIGGNGEETRDHIHVEDVATLTNLVIGHQSYGVLNIATGTSYEFKQVAEKVAALSNHQVQVCPTERNMPITYRSFDVTAIYKAFPGISLTDLDTGLAKAQE